MSAIGIVLVIAVAVPVVLLVRHAVRYWGAGPPRRGQPLADGNLGAYITQLRTGHRRQHVSNASNDHAGNDFDGSIHLHGGGHHGDSGGGDGGGGDGD